MLVFWIFSSVGVVLFLGQLGHGLEVYFMNKHKRPTTEEAEPRGDHA